MTDFARATMIRTLRTMAQVAIATIGSAAVLGDVRWTIVASTVALAAVLTVLTAIATGLPEADHE